MNTHDQYLFVYGTLRRDADSEMGMFLRRSADYIGEALFTGRLYMIDDYPGAVASDDASDKIKGDLYRLRDPEFILLRLDLYEECDPRFPEPHEYVREVRKVMLDSGRQVSAWIYLYNRSTKELKRIISGEFPGNCD